MGYLRVGREDPIERRRTGRRALLELTKQRNPVVRVPGVDEQAALGSLDEEAGRVGVLDLLPGRCRPYEAVAHPPHAVGQLDRQHPPDSAAVRTRVGNAHARLLAFPVAPLAEDPQRLVEHLAVTFDDRPTGQHASRDRCDPVHVVVGEHLVEQAPGVAGIRVLEPVVLARQVPEHVVERGLVRVRGDDPLCQFLGADVREPV